MIKSATMVAMFLTMTLTKIVTCGQAKYICTYVNKNGLEQSIETIGKCEKQYQGNKYLWKLKTIEKKK